MTYQESQVLRDRVMELMDYDPKTGEFRWKESRGGVRKGSVAGTKRSDGYIRISVDGKPYRAHRLAWLVIHGFLPEEGLNVDHENGIRHDNRIENLRQASKQCNARNMKECRNDNTSGVTGVCWHKQKGKWCAYIKVNGKRESLGYFKDFNTAVLARWKAECKHNWSNCLSESSAFKHLIEIGWIDTEGKYLKRGGEKT